MIIVRKIILLYLNDKAQCAGMRFELVSSVWWSSLVSSVYGDGYEFFITRSHDHCLPSLTKLARYFTNFFN